VATSNAGRWIVAALFAGCAVLGTMLALRDDDVATARSSARADAVPAEAAPELIGKPGVLGPMVPAIGFVMRRAVSRDLFDRVVGELRVGHWRSSPPPGRSVQYIVAKRQRKCIQLCKMFGRTMRRYCSNCFNRQQNRENMRIDRRS